MSSMTDDKERSASKWYERDAISIWAPVTAVSLATAQSLSYFIHRFFYESAFGVLPEEVGSDYATLLVRNALPLAVLSAAWIAVLAAMTPVAAFFVRINMGMDERDKVLAADPLSAGRKGRRLVLTIAVCAVLILSLDLPNPAMTLVMAFSALLVALTVDEIIARRRGEVTTWLRHFTATRYYPASRRLSLIIITTLLAWIILSDLPSDASFATTSSALVVATMFVYLIDVVVSSRSITEVASSHVRLAFGDSGRWLRALVLITFTALVGLTLTLTMPYFYDERRVELYLANLGAGRVENDIFSQSQLFQPVIRPVQAQWIGADVPSNWGGQDARSLWYLGTSAGIGVYYDPLSKELLRLPSANILATATRAQPVS